MALRIYFYRNFLYLEMVRGRPPTTLGGRDMANRTTWEPGPGGVGGGGAGGTGFGGGFAIWYRRRRCDALSRDRVS